jgi:uncharacterized membrane protein
MRPVPPLRRFLPAAFAVAYPLLAHLSSVFGSRTLALVSVAVLGAAVLGKPLSEGRRAAWIALPAVALGVVALARLDAVALLLFLPPVLLNAYLAWLFGHTLARDGTPLIERLVRLLQPPGVPFEPGVIGYARTLTALWTGMFVVLGGTNLVLALLATPRGLIESAGLRAPVTVPLEAWSLFANVLNYLIVAGLFLAEFAYRRRRFPGRPYRSLADFLRRAAAVAPALVASFARKAGPAAAVPAVERKFDVPVHHPAFAGHFPGRPVLPAVVLLDMVVDAAREALGPSLAVAGLPRAKFMAPLAPGDRGTIRLRISAGAVEFEVRRGAERVAQGLLQLAGAGPPGDR